MIPEWLTRDPLNGLVITVSFFISLIIGRYIREHRTAFVPGQEIRLLASVLLIAGITLMKHWYIPVIICALCMILALKLGRLNDYIKKLIFPLLPAIFILAVQWYSGDTGYGFLVFSRVTGSVSVLILLILTTSHTVMLENLRWLRLPGTMIEISSFMWRYITAFSNEGKKLEMAQHARCSFLQKSFAGRMQNTASVCGLLIMRAYARSGEVYRAMLSRGWKPGMHAKVLPAGRRDAVAGIFVASIITGLVIIDRLI